MAVRISAGPSSNDDSYTFAGGLGNNVSLNVRGNDGKSSSRPLHSLDDGQSGDLANADPISGAATTLDRSARGAAIWINADGTIGYSTSPIDALVKQLAPGETLQDSFLYATRQTNGSLLWSTVRITITGTNDAPTAANDRADALEDTLATGSVAANDRDVDNGAVLSFAATNAAAGFALAANGTWTLDTSHAVYQDLAAGEVRQIVIGYRVTDQFGASSTASLVVDVIGTNDRPVAVASSAQANEDGSVSGRLTATDADRGATLTYAVVGDAPEGLSLAADGSWTFTANTSAYQGLGAGQVRVLTVAYAATDQAGASGGSTLTITFTGINDAPVALAAAAEVTEDAAVSGLLAGTDADAGARLTFAVESGGAEGFALGADGQWTFDANQVAFQALAQGETAERIINYRVTDDHDASSVSTLTLTVTGANDAPVATSNAAEVAEGQSIAGQLSARDQDSGAQLRFAAIGRPPAGFALAADGSWTLDAADAAYRGLAAGAAQIIQVPFSVTDEHGARNESFLVIAVTGIDEAPMLKGTPPALPPATEDTAFIVTQEQLLAGWSDPDGGSLVAFGLTAANATVRANADGSFTVVPAANVNGTLQLNYDVGDGFRVSAASAEVEVLAVNDPAEIGGTLSGSVTEATPFGPGVPTAGGQLSVSDPDNALQFAPLSGIRSANGYGTVTLNDAGAWQYVLDNSQASVNALGTGQTLSDSFLVHSLDGTAATVNVTINGAVDVVRQPSWFSGTGDPNDFSAPMAGGDPSAEMWDTAANDTLVGTDADQRFWSYSGGNDIIYAQGGNDRIAGLGAGGTYYGQAGDDYIQASATSTIYGGTGGDEVSGSRDGDVIYGGSGVDSLRGYGGNDIIVGGYHIDNLEGGAGQDTFRFLDLRDSGDHILDFLYGTDSLDFSALDANQQLAGEQSFAWGGSTPTANGVWVQVLSDRTSLYLDTDGNPGTAEFMLTFLNSNMASVAGLQQAPERWLL